MMPLVKCEVEQRVGIIESAVIVYDVHSPAGILYPNGRVSEYGIQIGTRCTGEQADFHVQESAFAARIPEILAK